ncbi:unnamed protein product [Paramecium sonneborni]|uniref:Uncharacterized protein n=1 Tax=Paramecium sonneborni TaxID=65129 RepID=A0A8S1MQU5_9CILI|nr:unnamed protein product [Paramecium sonneborni]
MDQKSMKTTILMEKAVDILNLNDAYKLSISNSIQDRLTLLANQNLRRNK